MLRIVVSTSHMYGVFPSLSLSPLSDHSTCSLLSPVHLPTPTHFVSHTHSHTHTETPLLPSLHGANQKATGRRAGIRQMHLREETTRDRAKTAAALTFHVLESRPSDNTVSRQKLYYNLRRCLKVMVLPWHSNFLYLLTSLDEKPGEDNSNLEQNKRCLTAENVF